jgi:2-amino-4-hydroxy-6-hydroxymethyldihydropteridine diphosphokinase
VSAAFAAAATALRERVGPLRASSTWRSAPIGPPQPDFFNAALLIDTDEHPFRLLSLCRALEAAAGRDRRRETRWGPRPLDLDLLIVEDIVVVSRELTLPHPRLHERRFALLPAVELAADWIHPHLHRSLAELAAALDPSAQPCERLASPAIGA